MSLKALIKLLSKLESLYNNFFLGAEMDEKKFNLVSWKKVLSDKSHGGLGVSSLFALNRSLPFKWVRKF